LNWCNADAPHGACRSAACHEMTKPAPLERVSFSENRFPLFRDML
jgi:hypothetical protein